MVMQLDIKTENLSKIDRWLKDIPSVFSSEAKKVFQSSALRMTNQIKDNATNKLKVRTGALRRSIGQEVSGKTIDKLRASVFSAAHVGGKELKYAPIQELGGTVRAIDKYVRVPGGPYLNIPTTANKTPAGVTRLQAREVFNQGGYIAKSRAGNWGVWLDGKMMFVLKKQVEIPPRLGMVKAVDDEIPTLLSNLANIVGKEIR